MNLRKYIIVFITGFYEEFYKRLMRFIFVTGVGGALSVTMERL